MTVDPELVERLTTQGDMPDPLFDVDELRIGSLFSGFGGLDGGAQAVLGGRIAWHCEIDPAASRILAHHWPDVPNLGDITQVDWSACEPVDVLTGGFPCQDVSAAGRRRGMRPDTRSGLWTHMAYAIDQLQPALVVIENVRGLLSADAHCDLEPCPWCLGDDEGRPLRALGAVLGDLADLGYDASWVGLRAADIGAPHGRFRVFITAWPAGTDPAALRRRTARRDDRVRAEGLVPDDAGPGDAAAADTGGGELQRRGIGRVLGEEEEEEEPRERHQRQRAGHPTRDGSATPADTARNGRREGRAEPAGIVGGSDAALGGSGVAADADDPGRGTRSGLGRPAGTSTVGDGAPAAAAWGDYEPAIRRWEHLLGRPAPAPTVTGRRGGQQLSPRFVEWLMGLPEGHVTAVPGLSRNDQLKALGNGVVPAQAAAALTHLLAATETARQRAAA